MKRYRISLGTKEHLPLSCEHATGIAERMRGLLGRKELDSSEGLLIEPCKQIHTLFMKFPIDALFLNKQNEIVAIENLGPWRFSKLYRKANKVLELSHNTASRLGLRPGQRLEFDPC
jgi:uncharacterized protein